MRFRNWRAPLPPDSDAPRIAVIGCGYVGLVSGACFAELGNRVDCLDIDQAKIAQLRAGELPIYEPGLQVLVRRNREAGRLEFGNSFAAVVPSADFVVIAVNTPVGDFGRADLSAIEKVARSIADHVRPGTVVVDKSTVPVGTAEVVQQLIARYVDFPVPVVANPEFLREGSAVNDFLHPDRVVLGTADAAAGDAVQGLYAGIACPVVRTDLRSAEMIKYASNAYLAARISFINEIAAICERLGADVTTVSRGMGLDQRIGSRYLQAGIGWGGSCLGKDVLALEHMAAVAGSHPQLLRVVLDINRDARLGVLRRLRDMLGDVRGRKIALLGLAFKPQTDDIRDAPALEIARLLLADGAEVSACDPMAARRAAAAEPRAQVSEDPLDALAGADAAVLCTEWPQFVQLDWKVAAARMRGRIVIDGRNALDRQELRRLGFAYAGVGRPGPETVADAVSDG